MVKQFHVNDSNQRVSIMEWDGFHSGEARIVNRETGNVVRTFGKRTINATDGPDTARFPVNPSALGPGEFEVEINNPNGIDASEPFTVSADGPDRDPLPDDTVIGEDPVDTGDSGPEPEDVPGVVNADNPQGVALAPSLRERLGNIGGTVNVDGETLSVGPVTDADEMLPSNDSDGDGGSLLGSVGLLAALAAVAWVVFG